MSRLRRVANLEVIKQQCANIYKDIRPMIESLNDSSCEKIIKLLCKKYNRNEDEISDFFENYTDSDASMLINVIKPNSVNIFGKDIFIKLDQITDDKNEAEKLFNDSIAFDIVTRVRLYNAEKMFNDLKKMVKDEDVEEFQKLNELDQLVDEYSDTLIRTIHQKLKDKIKILTEGIVIEVVNKSRVPRYEVYNIMSSPKEISNIIDIVKMMLDNGQFRRIMSVNLVSYIRRESRKLLEREKVIDIRMIERLIKRVLNGVIYALAIDVQTQALKMYEGNTAKILPFKRK